MSEKDKSRRRSKGKKRKSSSRGQRKVECQKQTTNDECREIEIKYRDPKILHRSRKKRGSKELTQNIDVCHPEDKSCSEILTALQDTLVKGENILNELKYQHEFIINQLDESGCAMAVWPDGTEHTFNVANNATTSNYNT